MRIIYPYNEILPKRKAHDLFVFHSCAALAERCDITLLVGKGSHVKHLFDHYHVFPSERFQIHPQLIVRKNNPFGISWNFPFFFLCQRYIQKHKPDVVICSVRKQGAYHFSRKIPGVRYLFEVHELVYYPNSSRYNKDDLQKEKRMLAQADLITVTTQALKDILQAFPYSLVNPIEVVPLAVNTKPLPPPLSSETLQLAYVGQLYQGQGLERLLKALSQTSHVHLNILGGKTTEIAALRQQAQALGIEKSVTFLGFIQHHQIAEHLQNVHAFVAPFENTGRMPFVAHTKLLEYIHWGRPIIAPDLPIVREHFPSGKGVLLFNPDQTEGLRSCITQLQDKKTCQKLQEEITALSSPYSWAERAKIYLEIL